MNTIIYQISKIRRKIRKSSGCNYLYSYFDELIESLNANEGTALTIDELNCLKELIEDYAAESRYNNFASANWMRYSARCFYCADYLVRYLKDEIERNKMERFLNCYFVELVQHGVAPIILQDVLDKYIRINITQSNAGDTFNVLIRKAIDECGKCRYWRGNEVSLACKYTQSASRLIMDYITKYSDASVMKTWLPLFQTARLVKYWYEYPDSANYDHTGQYERETVMKSLDNMLDTHLKLISFWYWHNAQELIDTFSLDDLIEIFEVCEDDEFEKILSHAVSLPHNEKIERVLSHFEDDDEPWIVELSRRLLATYRLSQ